MKQIRILKNTSREKIETSYNGKRYIIAPKGSLKLDHNGLDEQAADYLLQTFGFLRDITPKPTYKKLQIGMAYGKKYGRDNDIA